MMTSNENKLFFPLPHIQFTDLPEKPCLVNVNETNVVICKKENKIYGFQDKCPHQGGPLDMGKIETLADKSLCIRCPLHGWLFDVQTGENKFPDSRKKFSIKTYPIKVDKNKISIGFDEINKLCFTSTDF